MFCNKFNKNATNIEKNIYIFSSVMVMMVMMMVMMVIFIPEMRSITIFCQAKHVKKSSDSFGQPMKPFAQIRKACLLLPPISQGRFCSQFQVPGTNPLL